MVVPSGLDVPQGETVPLKRQPTGVCQGLDRFRPSAVLGPSPGLAYSNHLPI